MDLVDLIDVEPGQAGGNQLPANFIDGIRRVKRCDEIPLQHRRCVLGVFIYQQYGRIVVRRPEQIDDQNRRTGLNAFRSGSP